MYEKNSSSSYCNLTVSVSTPEPSLTMSEYPSLPLYKFTTKQFKLSLLTSFSTSLWVWLMLYEIVKNEIQLF